MLSNNRHQTLPIFHLAASVFFLFVYFPLGMINIVPSIGAMHTYVGQVGSENGLLLVSVPTSEYQEKWVNVTFLIFTVVLPGKLTMTTLHRMKKVNPNCFQYSQDTRYIIHDEGASV